MLFKKKNLILFFITIFSTTLFAANVKSEIRENIKTSTYRIRYPNQVKLLLNQINPQEMWKNLTFLTNYPDRSDSHQNGIDAAFWIKEQVETLAKNAGRNDVTVFTVDTKGFSWGDKNNPFSSNQPSVVLKMGTSSEPAIIIGAHLDTVSCKEEGCVGEAPLPGADDDGSGTVTVMEVARTLLTSSMHFKKPIYLIWYAGEESDLLGSQAVIDYFQKQNISIDAVMQLDQVGYAKNNDLTMYLESDKFLEPDQHAHVDHDLTLFLQTLVNKYVSRPVELSCGGSSDNEAWTDMAHVKAVRPLESNYCDKETPMNPYTHQPEDTMDKLSLIHMTDYLKLAIAFAVEMAEPIL